MGKTGAPGVDHNKADNGENVTLGNACLVPVPVL